MAYLNAPRLHFAGRFRADVSTVNNYATHYRDPADPPDAGWNPGGSGSWGITDCTVTGAVLPDGTVLRTAADDPAIGVAISQTGRARLVDLDPQQQMVSEIWGMRLQLAPTGGAPAIKGAFKVTAFSDIWFNRALGGANGDFRVGSFYQSVLTGVVWGDVFGSRVLAAIKDASAAALLSIKFNVDGYSMTTHTGRVVGTIGPAQAGEPEHFVVGRHSMGDFNGPVWYFPAVVDEARGKLIADLGNALQTTSSGGPFDPALDLQIGMLTSAGQFTSLGRLPIGPAGWYEQTAGVCEFPADRALSSAESAALAATPLAVVQRTAAGLSLVAMEGSDGMHVRAEGFVLRLSANDTANVTLRASRFGKPLPNAAIAVAFDSSQLQRGPGTPAVGEPASGLSFPATVTTDPQGVAVLPLTAHSIATPRDYIDGQLYGVRYSLAQSDPQAGGYFDPADFISVLLFTDYQIPAAPTWWQDVHPILIEYEHLYPVMEGIVKLGDYDSVVDSMDGMRRVFSFPEEHPAYMPVTRDLSPAKRQMILNWLQTTGNGGKPNLGTPPAAPRGPRRAAALAMAAADGRVKNLGGKTAAAEHRRGAGRRQFARRPI